MTDDAARPHGGEHDAKEPGFFKKLTGVLFHDQDQEADFASALRRARENGSISEDSVFMIRGVLKVSELSASDIMVPRSQIKAIDLSLPREEWIRGANSSGHSRFPVIDGDFSTVKGLLHAKDLLNSLLNPEFRLEAHLREVKFIPETMSLNLLLKEFRREHQHLALVVDEFGEVAGLLTIEDVLEQIVGAIDDEFDTEDVAAGNIVSDGHGAWRIRSITPLDQFNEFFKAGISDPHCETVGGIIADRLERVPRPGDEMTLDGFRFRVLSADDRQAKMLEAVPATAPGPGETASDSIS